MAAALKHRPAQAARRNRCATATVAHTVQDGVHVFDLTGLVTACAAVDAFSLIGRQAEADQMHACLVRLDRALVAVDLQQLLAADLAFARATDRRPKLPLVLVAGEADRDLLAEHCAGMSVSGFCRAVFVAAGEGEALARCRVLAGIHRSWCDQSKQTAVTTAEGI